MNAWGAAAVGFCVGVGVMALIAWWAAKGLGRPKCQHDEIIPGAIRPYLGGTASLFADCTRCGRQRKFDLGNVAATDGALSRAAWRKLEFEGYAEVGKTPNGIVWRRSS